jgi:hypothetical protein
MPSTPTRQVECGSARGRMASVGTKMGSSTSWPMRRLPDDLYSICTKIALDEFGAELALTCWAIVKTASTTTWSRSMKVLERMPFTSETTQCWGIAEDGRGDIWIGTDDLLRFGGERFHSYRGDYDFMTSTSIVLCARLALMPRGGPGFVRGLC